MNYLILIPTEKNLQPFPPVINIPHLPYRNILNSLILSSTTLGKKKPAIQLEYSLCYPSMQLLFLTLMFMGTSGKEHQ